MTPIIPTVTIDEAVKLARAGRKWRIYMEYRGPNRGNKGGFSNKYWELIGEGTGVCSYAHGSITKGTRQGDIYSFDKGIKRARAKKKGTASKPPYEYTRETKPISHWDALIAAQSQTESMVRLNQPIGPIHALQLGPNGFQALDEDDHYIIDLTDDGAKSLLQQLGQDVSILDRLERQTA